MPTPDENLKALNVTLPPAPKPAGVYKPALQVGNMLYISGHGPLKPDGSMISGKVGDDLTLEQGQEAARQVGLTILASVQAHLGTLNKVKRLIKSLGMVNATADFPDHPKVINGYSDLMREVFGDDAGVGTRSAVGMGSLPMNIAVEVECLFEVE